MSELKDMKLFVSVVEEGSFARAARIADLTPAMVGRRIAALEEGLGFVLLNRTTRRMYVTTGGRTYYEGCKRILADVSELEESLTSQYQQNPTGLIRLSAPDGLGPFLIQAIRAFRSTYPKIDFDLDLENRPIDMVAEEFDLSLRLSFDLQDTYLVADKLADTTFGLYAAPRYLEERGVPGTFADLINHDCLHMGSSRYGDYWNVLVDGEITNYRQPWALVVSDTVSLLHAVREGAGIGLIPVSFAQSDDTSGALVALRGLAEFPTVGIFVVHPTNKHLTFRTRLFLDYLKQASFDVA